MNDVTATMMKTTIPATDTNFTGAAAVAVAFTT